MNQKIVLDFNVITLDAELFDTNIATRFYERLPYEVELTSWGNELYGSIGLDLGKENPIAEIPEGGIAYTNRGNLVCVFYGQSPAWKVEHIGSIIGNTWKALEEYAGLKKVVFRKVDK